MNTVVKNTRNKGRGVYAGKDFKKGALIARNDVIVYHAYSYADVSPVLPNGNVSINTYAMAWSNTHDAIALGHINLCNHSSKPNTRVTTDYHRLKKSLYALHNIKKDDELTFNYNCIWFKIKP